ncbi:MAG: hypothetical protein KA715_05325 [Xanthomonadaceae bacterium]|nr:hypothetical protein [Xanthomonadaceae bacterium]
MNNKQNPEFIKEKLASQFPGSVAHQPPHGILPEGAELLASIWRENRRIPCSTYFYSFNNKIFVAKVASDADQSKRLESPTFSIEWMPSSLPYVDGEEASEWLFRADSESTVIDRLCQFISFSFEHWKTSDSKSLNPLSVDALFINSIGSKNSYEFFDLEWKLSTPVSKSWYVFRNCFALGRSRDKLTSQTQEPHLKALYETICKRLGIESNYSKDLELEATFQALVETSGDSTYHKRELTQWFETPLSSSFLTKIKSQLLAHYFANPVISFAPYLLVYLISAALKLSISTTVVLFLWLHVFNFLGWIQTLKSKLNRQSASWFWICLFAVFMIPGAYLEFPSDAWEHLRRIFYWNGMQTITENLHWTRFAYFFGFSFLKWLPTSAENLFIDLYSTFWQMLLSIQVYRLSKRLNPSLTLARLQVVGFWCLFGHNAMNFRYYALSATPLAYIAFFENLIVLMDWRRFSFKSFSKPVLLRLFMGVLLMIFNHTQELLLFSIMSVAFAITWIPDRYFKRIAIISLGTLVLSWTGYYFLKNIIPIEAWIKPFSGFTHSAARIYDPFEGGYVSKWGTFRLWNVRGHYFETLGVFGFLSIFISIFYFKKNKTLSIFTLLPPTLMLFPPFVLGLTALTEAPNTYRVLYAFPTSYMIVQALYDLLSPFKNRIHLRNAIAMIIILSLGTLSRSPWRGRLRFQLEKTPDLLKLTHLKSLQTWIESLPFKIRPECRILTDNMASFYLSTKLNTEMFIIRNYPGSLINNETLISDYESYIINHNSSCMVILPKKEFLPSEVRSWVAKESGHWTHQSQNIQYQLPIDSNFEKYFKSHKGWKSYDSPPFYKIYIQENCPFKNHQCVNQ